MGPHPEAPVDIQKYIGSCLITQQPRHKRKSLPHPKDGMRCLRCSNYVPPCNRCCGAPVPRPGYTSTLSNYAWTGVPLISVARHKNHNQQSKNRPQLRNGAKEFVPRVESPIDGNLEELLPISRLAIHAQGAPLILSPKDGDHSPKDGDGYPGHPAPYKGQDFFLGEGNSRVYMLMAPERPPFLEEEFPLQDSDFPPAMMHGPPRAVASSPSQSDCISTTSEDSGTSENGLPRIIKPRKRRKKDRRTSESESLSEEAAGPIVTLKPYQPLCYRYKSNNIKIGSLNHKSLDILTPPKSLRSGAYPYPPSPRCQCPYCVPPPSTLLTPPDSPVSESGLVVLRREGGRGSPHGEIKFPAVYISEDEPNYGFEESVARNSNTLILASTHPPQRPWICMAEQDSPNSCIFTVMCYNILCDKYATRQMYGYCPNWALDWSYRKKYILQEIFHYKADIISLQEVETEQFYKYFLPELQNEGYDGIFSPKSRAKTMSEGERKHVDGCAIFYKTSKFLLVKDHLVEFNQLAMANAEGSDDMLNRVMTKDNIGLAALLQTRVGAYQGSDATQTSQTLLVCTAHIHWDPEYSDVKLIQTMMLMHELKTFVDDILQKCNLPPHQKQDPNIIPLLLCGDFNSLPNSGVIEYLSLGRVSTSHIDFKEFVYKDCLSKLGNSSKNNEFTHPFQISRAYSDGIMPFTNYSYDFKGVIDYVFYSKLHMSILGVLGPIDSAWLEENHIQGCPHPHIPSDHFPIVVELQLNPTIPLHPATPNGINLHR
ncbi:CCR4-NOT transcription complex subunit 6-like [Uloborus diversus]|uniref:CCR4-NOT transcription complex subunit 6-like n=1 Tax=Uloborus diversus TaxID=327109 RepID=UPI00240A69F7|nr:CCR4-NOT transcription complex subunit 6-like [Uloborus diversus]